MKVVYIVRMIIIPIDMLYKMIENLDYYFIFTIVLLIHRLNYIVYLK